ncbi:mitochondrial intermembrane space import and assembly protein 40 [Culicoides brevitarsis]|uniref:mitochondrial intermembrane space import and assembly protein 40 n=1 Tax=Culicoides brevitarsis TaxID=469753 RepID=UPI00307C4C01
MSSCKSFGKDKVVFATKEDHAQHSTVELPQSEPSPGLLLPNGDINWNCPCLGGMATGPCGVEFRDAFSCFHYSEAEPKGSECFDHFQTMQDCFAKYPTVYNQNLDDNDEKETIPTSDTKVANEYVDPMHQEDEKLPVISKDGAHNSRDIETKKN